LFLRLLKWPTTTALLFIVCQGTIVATAAEKILPEPPAMSTNGDDRSERSTSEFDYRLPKTDWGSSVLAPDLVLSTRKGLSFNAEVLASALASGCTIPAIKSYLQSYARESVKRGLQTAVRDHLAITYAIDRNSPKCLQMLLEYGADPNTNCFGSVPILGLAIMRTKWTARNATEIVKVLLANGADCRSIPANMWLEYVKVPTQDWPWLKPEFFEPARWCSPERRGVLAETLNLTMRYYLWRAYRLENHMGRTLQIARAHRMTSLLKIPFQIIGQEPATTLVMQNVYTHVATNMKKPLVFAFAGLSGHGKTELANRKLARSLSTWNL
jgi:hypothetical protein